MTEPSNNGIPPQMPDPGRPDGLFYPSEHAVLCDWFGLARPGSCAEIDLFDRPGGAPGIWPVLGKYGGREQALKNAVARIALGSIQRELPNFIYHDAESGRYLPARRFYPVPMRPLRLTPEFLFQINWADSGPGVSWPESYHLTHIFGYDRWVVTMSHDTSEAWGCTDLAIGWFGIHEPKMEGVRRVISDWWRAHGDGSAEQRWETVWEEGLVSAGEANDWADEVWVPAGPWDDEPPPPIPEMDFDYDFRPRYWPLDNTVPVPRGGEHLPPLLSGEVEIARIVLRSATPDVVSVRARPSGGGIRYRAVDEYEGATMYMEEGMSKDPLTLGQMLAVLDTIQFGTERRSGSFIWKIRESNLDAGADLEAVRDLVAVRSPFYPQLEHIYERRAWEWYQEKLEEGEEWRGEG